MNRQLEKMNSLHNFNMKKEDFNSFKNVKKYFDKFIKIIFMDSPTFVATLESADKYLKEDENYPYTKTFRPSDYGPDGIDAVIVSRYCDLLQSVLETIDPKSEMKFNIMDILQPKVPRLVSFLSNLSDCADSMQIIGCDARQLSSSDKVPTGVQRRQKGSLGNDAKYEGNFDEHCEAVQAQLRSWHFRSEECEEVLADCKSNNAKMNAQKKVAWGKREEFDKELLEQLQNECRKQSEKLFSLLQSNANAQCSVEHCGIASSDVSLYCTHLAAIRTAIESYEQVAPADKHKNLGPEIEINDHLLETNENLKEIITNRAKYFSQLDHSNSLKMENMRAKPVAIISPILKVKQARNGRRRSISAEESFV